MGMSISLLDEIVDHRCTDTAIKLADQNVLRANGRTYLQRSTIGWQMERWFLLLGEPLQLKGILSDLGFQIC